MFTACFIYGHKCPALFAIGYILWNNNYSSGKSHVNLEVKEVKPPTKKKKTTENKFTHEKESREENDAQLPNLKPHRRNGCMITSG